MDGLLQFPWPQVAAMAACLGYLIRSVGTYAAERKSAEGMLTREEYERDQGDRYRTMMADVRQLILDLTVRR